MTYFKAAITRCSAAGWNRRNGVSRASASRDPDIHLDGAERFSDGRENLAAALNNKDRNPYTLRRTKCSTRGCAPLQGLEVTL